MPNENEILPLQSDFEQIKRTDADGRIFWSARELSSAMGYSTYQKFCRILDKSMASAQAKGLNLADHFNRVVEMVKLGSGAFREVENVHLSREACLLVAENADRKKPQVQIALTYFSQGEKALPTVASADFSSILLYKTAQGESRIEVIFNSDTFWMPQKRMAELYGVEVNTINYHLKEIYASGELTESATIRKIGIVQNEGEREVTRPQMLYNLDAIIAVGYRVNSYQATQFRIWATTVLKEMIVKGFVLDDERLKQGTHFGKDYFDDLLERIREIRASERSRNHLLQGRCRKAAHGFNYVEKGARRSRAKVRYGCREELSFRQGSLCAEPNFDSIPRPSRKPGRTPHHHEHERLATAT